MKSAPHVAIVLLNFNGKQYLETYLPFLYLLTYSNYSIVVVDNASTDDSIDWLKEHYPFVQIIGNKENYGFAQGYNEGLRSIKSQYYLLLNTDVEVTPSFLEPMVALLEKNAQTAVCQPKVLSYTDRNVFEYAGAAGGMIDKLGYPFARGRLFFTCEEDRNQYDDEIEIFWASGACFLIKSECFWEADGFYNYFFMQAEELDLCWRLKQKGYKIMYTSKSKVYHVGGAHLSYDNPRKNLLNFRNNWIMMYRNMPSSYFWLYVVPVRTSLDILASFYFLYKTNLKNFLSVYSALFGFYKWLLQSGRKEKEQVTEFSGLKALYNKSVVIDYFLRGKKKFTDL